ncbi:MAG: hypothetical protein K0Q73_665 [Paenibacillus sp.]|nr:hypothetical protein [Paenibacillus sp.]
MIGLFFLFVLFQGGGLILLKMQKIKRKEYGYLFG